ncbi:MAG: 30S ribosomal protein S12 methylthiotransferase RimO [Clostridia bacterium]|nr:30S ribosomal protein S12 methylthiotransferase RimO [Clostridia bacterium]
MNKGKVYIDTLGCPKNQNDSEFAAGVLEENRYEITDDPEDADFVIVNTCGFIEDAKRESIDRIFTMAQIKKPGAKLIVSGCLAQRYSEELFEEMPEAFCFIGVNEYARIGEILDGLMERSIFAGPCVSDHLEKTVRKLSDNPYTSTIKIAEGCDRHCTYCVIPKIRGKYRSKRMEDVISEAEALAGAGCVELVLIAEDTSCYGRDLYGRTMLPELLRKLCRVEGIRWIRLMYCYDEGITEELADVMAGEEKICHYIDIPLQHASDKVLREMARRSDRRSIEERVAMLRSKMPDIAIRTTFIVGFPGETDEDFTELSDLVENLEFERLGVFKYSLEEGTPAGEREDQVPDETKEFRENSIMMRQMEISRAHNEALIGKTLDVIVDAYQEDGTYSGRTRYDAPEIDNGVIFTSEAPLRPGDIVPVLIEDAFDYDLTGRTV